jgi:hypothetical protein
MLTPARGGASIFLTREVWGDYKIAGIVLKRFKRARWTVRSPGKDVIRR